MVSCRFSCMIQIKKIMFCPDVKKVYYPPTNYSKHRYPFQAFPEWPYKLSFPETNKAESFAYKMSLHFPANSMSLTYIRKSNGSRMEPYGTPHSIILGLEKVPFIYTFWVRFVKYESYQETEMLLGPKAWSLSDNKEWFTVSKAFCRSIMAMPV